MYLFIDKTKGSRTHPTKEDKFEIYLGNDSLYNLTLQQAIAHEIGHTKTSKPIDCRWGFYRANMLAHELKAWGWALSKLPLDQWNLPGVKKALLSYCENKKDRQIVREFIDRVKQIKLREENK